MRLLILLNFVENYFVKAHELALRGYDVVIAARDVTRGKQLVAEILKRLAETPICNDDDVTSDNSSALPAISFVEYHADQPNSALDLAAFAKGLDGHVTVLINNAGIMGKSKQLTMKVNLLGPIFLTMALIPLLNESSVKSSPIVINVGSSAHLRATHVIDEEFTLEMNETYISALPSVEDKDLSTYSQSKLALMQFSTFLRHSLSKGSSSITVCDAHPGLVWTPLLRNHIGDRAANILYKTGLAELVYKTPLEGAQSLVAALDFPRKMSTEQIYFENGKPDGYATPESRDYSASSKLWKYVIAPEVEGRISLPHEISLELG